MEQEYADFFNTTIQKSQKVLGEYILPDSKLTPSDLINTLLGILDDQELVKMQTQFLTQK